MTEGNTNKKIEFDAFFVYKELSPRQQNIPLRTHLHTFSYLYTKPTKLRRSGIATAVIKDSSGSVVASNVVSGKENRITFNTTKGESRQSGMADARPKDLDISRL